MSCHRPRFLYHLTPRYIRSIEPSRSKGLLPVSWYCTYAMIPWAIRHLSKHHGRDMRYMCVCDRASFRGKNLQRRRKGIYVSYDTIIPDRVIPIAYTWPNLNDADDSPF